MAKIDLPDINVRPFAEDDQGTVERTVFGDGNTQSDELADNLNNSFFRGWGIIPINSAPPIGFFSAVSFTISKLISYFFQFGLPEWRSNQEYQEGSRVQFNGSIFRSLTDNNVGNSPSLYNVWVTENGGFSPSKTNQIPFDSTFLLSDDSNIFDLPNVSGLRDRATIRLTKDINTEPTFRVEGGSGEIIKQFDLDGNLTNQDDCFVFDVFGELILIWNEADNCWEF